MVDVFRKCKVGFSANALLADMKAKLDADKEVEEKEKNSVEPEVNSGGSAADKLKEFVDRYSISASDKHLLEKLLREKVTKQDPSGTGSTDMLQLMTDSLASTKSFLHHYLSNFQTSLNNLNMTSQSVFNGSHENILNVSEVLRVSELVGNTVFEVLSDKMTTISQLKQNLTLDQVEEFASSQAQATVSKLNNIVSKTAKKLSTVKDGIASNEQLVKLKKEANKVMDTVVKGAVSQWNSLAQAFVGVTKNKGDDRKEFNEPQTIPDSEQLDLNKKPFARSVDDDWRLEKSRQKEMDKKKNIERSGKKTHKNEKRRSKN